MTFPWFIELGPFPFHPHPLFEGFGYFLGYRLYILMRQRGDHVNDWHRLVVLAGAIIGGMLGSKMLAWFEDPALMLTHLNNFGFWTSGKSIVGGLIGGLIGVEFIKKRIGVTTATGDLYALPLIFGMAIGRIGCFLTGLEDNTHGIATTLPWGIDFGDGITRHPAQLYELLFLLALAGFILWRRTRPHQVGDLFKCFMVGYLGWRLLVDFIKPYPPVLLGLGTIQWACLLTILYYAPHIPRLLNSQPVPAKGA